MNGTEGINTAALVASLPGLPPDTAKHRAPEVGHDPATDPRYLRTSWIAEHGVTHLPAAIRTRRFPDHLTGADRMGGGQCALADYLHLKGEL